MMRWILALTMLLGASFTYADTRLTNFEKRFEMVRNEEGTINSVRSRIIPEGFSLRPYLTHLKELLVAEQTKMLEKHDYESELFSMMDEEYLHIEDENKNTHTVLNTRLVTDALLSLKDLDIEAVFNDEGFQEVVGAYESRLGEAFLQLDPRMLARLDNPTFFYQKTVGHQVLRWGLDFAKRRLSSVPVLNTASFVLVEVERMVRERRHTHQNMLMHYLENFTPSELSMTDVEVAKIFSSIYESRIPWFNIFDSRAAQAEWNAFGLNRFYQGFRNGSNRLRNFRNGYSSLGVRYNFGFQEAIVGGERVILNLFDNQNMFQNRPALAFNYDQPNQVMRQRSLMMLADLGLSFVTIPQFIKDFGSSYLKSHYEQQRLTEGALQAYFEQVGQPLMTRALRRQYFNPFDL